MSKRRTPSRASLRHAFRTIIWPRRRLIAIGFGLIVIGRLCALVVPVSTKFLVDDVIGRGDLPMLWKLVTVVGIATFIQAGTGFLLARLLSVEAQRLIAQLRATVQRHVLRLPIRTFDDTKSGELVSRVMNDVEGVRNLVGTGLVQLVGGILTSVVALSVLLYYDPLLTLLALVPLGGFGLASMKTFRVLRPAFRERGQILAEVTGRLTETLGGVRVIKGFNAERREEIVFEQGVDRVFRNVRKTLTASAAITSLATLLMGIASVMIMGYGGSLILRGQLTVGELFSFTLFLAFLVGPIVQMANIGTERSTQTLTSSRAISSRSSS